MNSSDRDVRLFPIEEAARLLGVCRATLDREAKAGRLVLTKIRWKSFVAAEDLEAFLRLCRRVKASRPIGLVRSAARRTR